LDLGADATAPHSLWAFRTPRLFGLASFYACGVADLGTSAGRIALPRFAVRSYYLFHDANDGEPLASA